MKWVVRRVRCVKVVGATSSECCVVYRTNALPDAKACLRPIGSVFATLLTVRTLYRVVPAGVYNGLLLALREQRHD